MPDTNDRVTLFRGVQKYLIGAVIVGQSIAITSMAMYIVSLQKEHVKEIRNFLMYIQTKSDRLMEKLGESQQTNEDLVNKMEEAASVFKPKTGAK